MMDDLLELGRSIWTGAREHPGGSRAERFAVDAPTLLRRSLLASLALVGPSLGQCPSPPPGPLPPSVGGSWSFVYNLPIPTTLSEITHTAVLPRATVGPNPTPHEGKVLFWCRRTCTPPPSGPSVIFRWSPLTPGTIDQTITVPNGPATDIWCGGHNFLETGDLFIAGGTDFINGLCSGPFTGQNAVFRFSNATQAVVALPSMARDHWYGSIVELWDGSEWITGH
jgi:hypothetical protein